MRLSRRVQVGWPIVVHHAGTKLQLRATCPKDCGLGDVVHALAGRIINGAANHYSLAAPVYQNEPATNPPHPLVAGRSTGASRCDPGFPGVYLKATTPGLSRSRSLVWEGLTSLSPCVRSP